MDAPEACPAQLDATVPVAGAGHRGGRGAADLDPSSVLMPRVGPVLATGPGDEAPSRPPAAGDDDTSGVLTVRAPGITSRLLEVRYRIDRDDVHHRLIGELCFYTSPALIEFLETQRSGRDVVLDLSRLSFIDSYGVSACLELVQRWRGRGRTLEVANPSAVVCRLATIMGVDVELFDVGIRAATSSPSLDRPVSAGAAAPVGSDGPGRPAPAPATVTVRNLDRGQVIEVAVDGSLDAADSVSLARRLETLSAKREPAELRVDLTRASPPHDPSIIASLHRAADVLDAIGSRLVVVGADSGLADAISGPPRSSSLRFEPTAPR